MSEYEFPKRLKELRTSRELSMEMLALDLNIKYGLRVNKGTISRWESGESDPSLSFGILLADYFNVSVDYLVGQTDTKTPTRLLAYAKRLMPKGATKEEIQLFDDICDHYDRKEGDT